MDADKQSKIDLLKKIYIMPYSHTDYAWTNTRDWHISRYIEGLEQILKLMESNKEITWILDNVIHGLTPVIENRPEILGQIRQRVAEGRIYVANGGVSLIRPSYSAAETYIRNLVYSKRMLSELLGVNYELDFLFNADTACGHSQLPQVMKLTGHKYYRFFRPENSLNTKGIPKQFIWTGLDGSSIIASRGNYGGFLFADYLSLDLQNDWEKVKEGFYDEDLADRLSLIPTGHVMLNHGCDDCFPLHNLYDKPIKLLDFMNAWNEKEKPRMEFSTPKEYFTALEKEKLPHVKGVLDHSELSYNLPVKADQSIWRKRFEIDTMLTRLEKLSSIAVVYGIEYDEDEIKKQWLTLFEITGHAIEFIIDLDYREIYFIAMNTFNNVAKLIKDKLKEFAGKVCTGSGNEYIVVNTEGFDVTQVVRLHVTSPNGVRNFELFDMQDNKLEYQFADTYTGDKNYLNYRYNAADVLVLVSVKAMSFNIIRVKELEGCLPELDEKSYLDTTSVCFHNKDKNFSVETGDFTAQFENACLIKFSKTLETNNNSNNNNSNNNNSNNNNNNNNNNNPLYGLRFVSTKPATDWLSEFVPINEEYFIPTSQRLVHNGPIHWKYEVHGMLGTDKVKQVYTISKLDGTIDIDVEIDSEGREGFYTADFKCDPDSKIFADIPFGFEKREFPDEKTSVISLDSANLVEFGYKGQFYANTFAAFEYEKEQFSLLSKNCSIYYNFDNSGRISLVLSRNFDFTKRADDRGSIWIKQTPEEMIGKGVHHYSFSLMVGGVQNNFMCDSAKKCREKKNALLVTRSFLKTEKYSKTTQQSFVKGLFAHSLETFITTAAYFENASLIVRGYESAGVKGKGVIYLPDNVKRVVKTDLLLNNLEELYNVSNFQDMETQNEAKIEAKIEMETGPFEIVTIKIDFLDEEQAYERN